MAYDSLIITAPSGGGKGSLIDGHILRNFTEKFLFSKSCTTRPVGSDENYTQLSREDFENKIMEDYFIEYEEVSGNYYGTPRNQFTQASSQNKILLLDIDINGAVRLRKLLQNNLFVFIDSGDDKSVYEQRIRNRNRASDTEVSIKKRCDRIQYELQSGRLEADVIIYNTSTIDDMISQFNEKVLTNF